MTTWPIQPYHPSDKARSVAHVVHFRKSHATHKQTLAMLNFAKYTKSGMPVAPINIFEPEYSQLHAIKDCIK